MCGQDRRAESPYLRIIVRNKIKKTIIAIAIVSVFSVAIAIEYTPFDSISEWKSETRPIEACIVNQQQPLTKEFT